MCLMIDRRMTMFICVFNDRNIMTFICIFPGQRGPPELVDRDDL